MSRSDLSRAEKIALATIEQSCACISLRKAARIVTRRFDDVFREIGLRSTQAPILMELAMHGPLNMANLAKLLAVDKSTLSRNVTRLEDQKLIARRSAEGGQVQLFATEAGLEKIRELVPLWHKAQGEVRDIISDENWQGLLAASEELQSSSLS